jgi:DeoR/GlpR family transcriptional regulator of sugar metabolism
MLVAERQRKILQEVKNKRAVKIFELSQLFNVSEMTIRRDLEKLDSEGLLQRTYGGALAIEKMALEPTFQEKDSLNMEEKQRIGRAAASMVNEGNTVFLSTGTTTFQIIENLVNKRNITVVTNSLNNAYEICKLNNTRLFVIGGEVRKRSYAMIMPQIEESLKGICIDKFFLGVNGLSYEYGLTIPNPLEAQLCRLVIQKSRETIVVADHSKFGKVTLAYIVNLDEINKIITDSAVDREYIDQIKDKDIEVILV